MQPDLKSVRGLAFDIDETLSTQGKLTDEAFSALWNLKRAGFALVPITGRPAGWCDHIVRFWPVDAVVGENGAFVFVMNEGKRTEFETPKGISRSESQRRLADIWSAIQGEFPEARTASDQDFRRWDLAVDLCEDVKPWSKDRVRALQDYVERLGAHAKLSSIHLNIWLGQYTKATGFQHWLKGGCPGLKKPLDLSKWAFIGDSPNDEPSFELFPVSAAVANIKKYLKTLTHQPTLVMKKASGAGFSEFAGMLRRASSAKKC